MSAVLPVLSSILFPRYWNLPHSFRQLSVIDNELVWLQRPLGAAGCRIRSSGTGGSGGSHFKRRAVHRSLLRLCLNMQQVLEKKAAFQLALEVPFDSPLHHHQHHHWNYAYKDKAVYFSFTATEKCHVNNKKTNENRETLTHICLPLHFENTLVQLRWHLTLTCDIALFSQDSGLLGRGLIRAF